jgi:hypothetical protein
MRVQCALAVGFLLLCSALSWTQTTNTGTVLGLVRDPSGAVVPGASVQLQDPATGVARTVTTNAAGRYVFVGVAPGTYSVRVVSKGFQQSLVPTVVVEVGKSYTIDVELQVGQMQQTVEVTVNPGAELQMLDSTIGSTIGGDTLLWLPTLQRSVTALLLLQPTAIPQQGGNQAGYFGGQVAGARSDQNMIVLDGGNITNAVSGNSDYYSNFQGTQEGPIPTPVESIQEFRVATSNPTASFSGSAGSETVVVTKRGSNAFHGSVYEYLQNDNVNANTWARNRLRQIRPESKDNRFGGSLGGYIPGLPESFKTFFYMHYEGRRLVSNFQVSRTVPTDTMRQGILRFRDASGSLISYNLATAQQCGSQGNQPCDPRGLGLNPVVGSIWNKYLPAGNDSSLGDGLNTIGFSGAAAMPNRGDFGVIRLDHSFGSNWQAVGSYRLYKETAAANRQFDIGGLAPGNTKGVPAVTSTIPRQPRYLVLSATGIVTPNLTNESSFSFMRDWWSWPTAGATPQVPGTAAALVVGGMDPVNLGVGQTRQRAWNSHTPAFRENLSWQRGTHFFRFGGTYAHTGVNFNRDDSQGALLQPLYNVTTATGVIIPTANRPPTCTSTLTTNCLPSSQSSNWNLFYAQALGLVDSGFVMGTRNANLEATPGARLSTSVTYSNFSLYANDSWHLRPTLTLSYGLNWSVEPPPSEADGKQILSLDSDSRVIVPRDYLDRRRQAALNGQVYNPTLGFAPIKSTGRQSPYDAVWDTVAPRVSLAWSPQISSGFLGKIFGGKRAVFRGGYARLFDRLNGVQKTIDPLQGLGFGQPVQCVGPSRDGQCKGNSGTDPSTAFRIGVDGSTVPLQALSGKATVPLIPGVTGFAGANQPYAQSSYQIDPQWVPGKNNQWNFTIQRELPGNSLLEIGYVRRTASDLYSPLELNQVPFFMVLGGQSFAQAFDTVAAQVRSGVSAAAVTPQPFFEKALAGSALCSAPNPSCTAGMASRFSGSLLNTRVRELWNGIQPSFVFGTATPVTNQVGTYWFWSSQGYSNYNAAFVSYRVRNWKGLTLDGNFTYGHSLDTAGYNQDQDTATANAFDLHYDHGNSLFDRKFVFNLLGRYELPFARGKRGGLNYLVQGWSVAPIFTAYTGLPLHVVTGSGQEFGQGNGARGAGAILLTKNTFGNSVHSGVAGNPQTQVGTGADPLRGGSGLNLFADPSAVYASFRPTMLSVDTTSNGGGRLRGLNRWNLDLTLMRRFRLAERMSFTLNGQFFNFFNHPVLDDPTVNLQNPATFGVLAAQTNYPPRVVQFGLRLDF